MPMLAENKTMLMLKPGARNLYQTPPGTAGIVFPFQPDIAYSQPVNYTPYDLTHTNYTFNAYRNTPSPTVQITAQFASATDEEGRYTLGCIHFLRSITKMWFGINESTPPGPGTPPPVLEFSSFGTRMFNRVPVVVSSFATTFDSGVDLKLIDGQSIPAVITFAIDLMVQVSPDRQKNEYSTSSFISGSAYSQGFI